MTFRTNFFDNGETWQLITINGMVIEVRKNGVQQKVNDSSRKFV
jgi:hypothetical protein